MFSYNKGMQISSTIITLTSVFFFLYYKNRKLMLWFLRISFVNRNPDYQQSGEFPYNFWQADVNFISNKRKVKFIFG